MTPRLRALMPILRVNIHHLGPLYIYNPHDAIEYTYFTFCSFSVAEKENFVTLPTSVKEESHKREINRDGEKEDKTKRLRKAESKENIQPSVEKKQVIHLKYQTVLI